MFSPEKPHNDLPGLPPAIDVETKQVLKAVASARSALGELKGQTGRLPNPDILLNTIALQEARSSSEIENIFTTNDELYRGIGDGRDTLSPEQKEVVYYRDALWKGAAEVHERKVLTTNLFIELVQILKASQAGIRRLPGTRIANPTTGKSVYTPPEGEERILALLGNLERFANEESDGLDPLVKAALIHYQFEAIHPFHDGNGRVGRIILILYLLLRGLLDQPVLFVSRYIIEHKSDYYRLLREVTEKGSWEAWVLYVVRAIEETAVSTCRRIAAIEQLLLGMTREVREKLPKIYTKELVELLFKQPYCKISFLVEEGLAERRTASRYLSELAGIGVLTSRKEGRDLLFLNHRLMDLLSSGF